MGKKYLVKDGLWRRVTDAWLRQHAKRIAELERQVAELERQVAQLEAGRVFPVYPRPWYLWPEITWTCNVSTVKVGS